MSGRVFILGIDGGEFRVVDHLRAAGQLPNFDSLLASGTRRTLLSSVPPLTPAAWASLYTGVNPGRHGVTDFLARREGSYRLHPVHRGSVSGRTLWQAAAEAGRKSLVVNVPLTYPPDALEGWMVSGMDTPGPHNRYTHPPELRGELLARFPGYRPDVHLSRRRLAGGRDLRRWYAREVLALEETRMEAVLHLAAAKAWDLGLAVLVSTDRLQHVFWREVEESLASGAAPGPEEPAGAVFEAYRGVDRFLPRLLGLLGPRDHLMVVSDHGFGPLAREVNLNALLHRLGFLAFAASPPAASLTSRAARRAVALLPERLRQALWRILPAPRARRLEGLDSLEKGVDWERTRAYAVGYLGGVFINLRGREPRGIVPETDYGRTLDELAAALDAFRDPAGGPPLVTDIRRNRDVYAGPRAASLPDLVLTLEGHRATSRPTLGGPGDGIFSRPQDELGPLAHTGGHRPEGIFIGSGPRFGAGARETAGIADVFPTALALMGITPPAGLDGRDMLGPTVGAGSGAVPPPTDTGRESRAPLSPEEERAVMENLKDLGYL